jgi:hypothetical protein
LFLADRQLVGWIVKVNRLWLDLPGVHDGRPHLALLPRNPPLRLPAGGLPWLVVGIEASAWHGRTLLGHGRTLLGHGRTLLGHERTLLVDGMFQFTLDRLLPNVGFHLRVCQMRLHLLKLHQQRLRHLSVKLKIQHLRIHHQILMHQLYFPSLCCELLIQELIFGQGAQLDALLFNMSLHRL